MAKVFRANPVGGTEYVMTKAGLLTFLNGEAEIEDDKASLLSGISDMRVRIEKQSTSSAGEAAALQAAAKEAEEKAAKEAEEKAAKEAEEKAAKEAEEKAEAAPAPAPTLPPKPTGKRTPPALK